MKETLNLDQNLQTTQRLSPQQVQFVRMLEMTVPEIEEEVRQQLEDNPALEAVDAHAEDAVQASDTFSESADELQRADYRDDDDLPPSFASRSYDPEREINYENTMGSSAPTLAEMLTEQLGQLDLPQKIERIAEYIIGNIDENGYLTRSLTAIADDIAFSIGEEVDRADMRKAFDAVRSLEPAGVCAVDLRDCLLLQLKRIKPTTLTLKIAIDVVANYFDLFSKKHYEKILAQLDLIDKKELDDALALIRSLNPKPGREVNDDDDTDFTRHITPDFAVEGDDSGRFTVSLLGNIPQLQIERAFDVDASATPAVSKRQREAEAFIRLKRGEASSFINMLERRGQTLIAVMEAIVKLQPEFFATGDKRKLRPMILRDVSAITGLDLSVISRAISDKYVMTPAGVFPLKMFLNERPRESVKADSTQQVIDALKSIIDDEDKQDPLSDRELMEALAEKGFDVARRTVTKYREKLGYPVGRLRVES